MSCGIENLKCGVKWLDDIFETYEEVQIGMEVPYCIRNIIALKKAILNELDRQKPSTAWLSSVMFNSYKKIPAAADMYMMDIFNYVAKDLQQVLNKRCSKV